MSDDTIQLLLQTNLKLIGNGFSKKERAAILGSVALVEKLKEDFSVTLSDISRVMSVINNRT